MLIRGDELRRAAGELLARRRQAGGGLGKLRVPCLQLPLQLRHLPSGSNGLRLGAGVRRVQTRKRITERRSLSPCRGSRSKGGGELLLGSDTTGVRPGPRGLGLGGVSGALGEVGLEGFGLLAQFFLHATVHPHRLPQRAEEPAQQAAQRQAQKE